VNVWLLTGDDEAVAVSEQTGPGDLVVHHGDDGVRIGELRDEDAPSITWWGPVDEELLAPDRLRREAASEGPLQRVQDADLVTAIEGIATAQRQRGG
jgi:hypothetical protein